jgi:hypothetical protein
MKGIERIIKQVLDCNVTSRRQVCRFGATRN